MCVTFHFVTPFPGNSAGVYLVHVHACTLNIHTHKINLLFKRMWVTVVMVKEC